MGGHETPRRPPLNITMKILTTLTSLLSQAFDAMIYTGLGSLPLDAPQRLQDGLQRLRGRSAGTVASAASQPSGEPAGASRGHPVPDHKITIDRSLCPPEAVAALYYQVDGRVYHRRAVSRGKPAGSEAGTQGSAGRAASVYFAGQRFPRSHIVFVLFHGRWPTHSIFHRNFIRDDDRPENLIESTHSEICRSAKVSARNIAGKKGVGTQTNLQPPRFVAQIARHGLRLKLGTYPTPEQAHRVYGEAAARLHGHFNPASTSHGAVVDGA